MARALLVNGTVGVGKTSVAEAVGVLLGLDGVPHAVVDLDWLRKAWPAPVDDRFNERLALINLASVTRNFEAAGAELVVIAGVVESADQREAIARASGGEVWSCRLRVEASEGEERLRNRHHDDESALSWHLYRFGELDAALDAADLDDAELSTTGSSVGEVARLVLGDFNAKR
jgi:adenylylsulfate kinase